MVISLESVAFSGKTATPLSTDGVKLCRRAGIHDLTFHDLRHSAATWLLEAGVDFAVIHNWEARLRDAVTRLEAFVFEKLRQAETEETSGVGSYGQLMGSWKNDDSHK